VSDLNGFEPRAVVFDLDGTLVDNMPWHTRAFDAFLERRGRPALSMEWRRCIDGKRNSEIFPLLFDEALSPEQIGAFEAEKEGLYREISRGALTALAGAHRLLDGLSAAGIAVAVATSAPAENVTHTLAEIGLTDRLPLVVRGDQVPRGKPAPDIFLHAASLLGEEPVHCLAFEDAPLGVAAARTAGMRCVAITSSFPAEEFQTVDLPPDWTCPDFDAYVERAGSWLAGRAAQPR